ncbi:hypothetical protein EI94DRAFT_1817942 [Lactarius quietus]|nr:hypothetical protein EI94DRAFT_1817942 [Lactarius quietus]
MATDTTTTTNPTPKPMNKSEVFTAFPYPSGCVPFTPHVPPDMNKTALRALFRRRDHANYAKGLAACAPPSSSFIDF